MVYDSVKMGIVLVDKVITPATGFGSMKCVTASLQGVGGWGGSKETRKAGATSHSIA